MRKTTTSIKEAREIKKHLDALDISYDIEADRIWIGKDGIQIWPSYGTCKIRSIGYKYAEVKADGQFYKAKPDTSDVLDDKDGRIIFKIYGIED